MADTKTAIEVRPRIVPKEQYKEPKNFNVVYLNDDVTTFEFVVETLTSVFGYAREGAEALTIKVNDENSAVVATLPYEMAEQKGIETTVLARNNGFPLQVKLEIDA